MRSRFNRDPVINEYGRDLINICTASGLRILNGRTPGDTPGQLKGNGVLGLFCAHCLG